MVEMCGQFKNVAQFVLITSSIVQKHDSDIATTTILLISEKVYIILDHNCTHNLFDFTKTPAVVRLLRSACYRMLVLLLI